jgi:hypothetical protein
MKMILVKRSNAGYLKKLRNTLSKLKLMLDKYDLGLNFESDFESDFESEFENENLKVN